MQDGHSKTSSKTQQTVNESVKAKEARSGGP